MTKAELIEELAVRVEVPKAKVQRLLAALCEVVGERLSAGEIVALPPLGRFVTVQRAARTVRNPQTGETITVPEKTVVRFKASTTLTRRMM